MSKLALVNRIPRSYDQASLQEVVRLLEAQANKLAEGAILARHGAMTAAPTTGNWAKGDLVDNSNPAVVSSSVADYVIVGWICTASGTPGTWQERRVLIEDITVPLAATQAEQETGSSTSIFVSPGRQQFHQSAVKAWAHVAVAAGAPTLTAGYNISSIVDNGVGDFTFNFTTAFSSVNYAIAGISEHDSGTAASMVFEDTDNAKSASACRISVLTIAGALYDARKFSVWFMGDQ